MSVMVREDGLERKKMNNKREKKQNRRITLVKLSGPAELTAQRVKMSGICNVARNITEFAILHTQPFVLLINFGAVREVKCFYPDRLSGRQLLLAAKRYA